MSNGSVMGASTQVHEVADHAVALDALLTEAENDRRPVPSDISDMDDDSSQLTELDDEDESPNVPGKLPLENAAVHDVEDDNEDDEDEENDEVDNDLADTEAETERLEISPQKLNNLTPAGRKPKRIDQQSGADDSDEEMNGMSSTPRLNTSRLAMDTTAMPTGSDGESSLTDADEEIEDANLAAALASKKRKRSLYSREDTEMVDAGRAKKRSASSARGRMSLNDSLTATLSRQRSSGDLDDEAVLEDDESDVAKEESAPENKGAAEKTDSVEELEPKVEAVAGEEESEHELSEAPEDLEQLADATGEVEEDAAEDGVEDDDAEAAARTEEELMKKRQAMDKMIDIEKYFAIFRDKLYDEKLAALDQERYQLESDSTEHPEYMAMLRTLDLRRDEKIRIEQASLRYKEDALRVKTVASRAIMFGQYFQTVRWLRESSMEVMNAEFSQIQRERRQWKVRDPQYVVNFPPTRPQQVANQVAYNKEVSLLSGIARHVGFPAAPEITGASTADVESDLREMRIRPQPSQYVAQVKSSTRAEEALATQKFIEQNAWANPDHPSHRQAYTNDEQAATTSTQNNLTTPHPTNKKFSDVHQPGSAVPGSGSTIDAPGSGPYGRDTGASSSPFEQFRQRVTSRRPSPSRHTSGLLNGTSRGQAASTSERRTTQTSVEDTNIDAYSRNNSRPPGLNDTMVDAASHPGQLNRYPFSSPLGAMASQTDVAAGSR